MSAETTAVRSHIGRRAFLRAVGASTVASVAASTPAAAQENGTESGSDRESGAGDAGAADGTIEKSWFDGVVDETGKDSVTVAVGADGNGGSFAFEPAAVRVDPGTTVVWKWTGEGGGHNVASDDGSFESEIVSDRGHRFEHAFESERVTPYVCVPHQSMGMRGAVLVGSEATVGASETTTEERSSPYGGWMDGVENFETVLDETGQERITVRVGTQGNGGNFAFSPPAIAIDPGTTVVWRWEQKAGALNLAAKDGSFWTDFGAAEGDTFEWTFTDNEVVKYSSPSYEALGMKGLIVVGEPGAPTLGERLATPGAMAIGGGLAMALCSPVVFGVVLLVSRFRGESNQRSKRDGTGTASESG